MQEPKTQKRVNKIVINKEDQQQQNNSLNNVFAQDTAAAAIVEVSPILPKKQLTESKDEKETIQ